MLPARVTPIATKRKLSNFFDILLTGIPAIDAAAIKKVEPTIKPAGIPISKKTSPPAVAIAIVVNTFTQEYFAEIHKPAKRGRLKLAVIVL